MKVIRQIILNILLTAFAISADAQQLSVQQTIDYLNRETAFHGDNTLFRLEQNGYLTYRGIYSFFHEDIDVYNYSAITTSVRIICKSGAMVAPMDAPRCIKCLKGCGITSAESSTPFIDIEASDSYTATKVFNAIKYLFSLIKEVASYRRDIDDPFAPANFNQNASGVTSNVAKTDIALAVSNGVYEIEVSINGVKKKFILDSGASDVSISEDVERELIQKGALKKAYYISPALYKLADGNIVSCRRFNLSQLKVGAFTVKNVRVAVGTSAAPLLLGKSFLDRFSKWSIDNNSNKLHLEK